MRIAIKRDIIFLVSSVIELMNLSLYQAGSSMEWILEKENIIAINNHGEILMKMEFSFVGSEVVETKHFYIQENLYGMGMDDLSMKVFVAFLREKSLKVIPNELLTNRWFQQNINEVWDVLTQDDYQQAEAS